LFTFDMSRLHVTRSYDLGAIFLEKYTHTHTHTQTHMYTHIHTQPSRRNTHTHTCTRTRPHALARSLSPTRTHSLSSFFLAGTYTHIPAHQIIQHNSLLQSRNPLQHAGLPPTPFLLFIQQRWSSHTVCVCACVCTR